MKTKKEIEKLAETQFPKNHIDKYTSANDNSFKRQGFIKGYNQCQQDNADKKFTKEDIERAFTAGWNAKG